MPFRKYKSKPRASVSGYMHSVSAAKKIQRAWRRKRRFRANVVKRVLRNQEPYKYDMTTLNNPITSSWSFLANLSEIPFSLENEPNSRQGTKVQLKNMSMRTTLNVGSTDTFNIVRLAIVRGRRVGELNANQIAYDPNSTGDDLNLPFNQRFVDVKWDKTYKLQEQAAGSVYAPFIHLDVSKYLGSICKYTESGVDITDQPYNNTSFYLIGCSDSTTLPHPQTRGQIRVSFKDLE